MREHCMLLPVETLPLFSVCELWECGCIILRMKWNSASCIHLKHPLSK